MRDSESWYFGCSERSRQYVADAGVEISQYCDDLEAVSFTLQPERNAEYHHLCRWLFQQRKQIH